MGGALLLLPLLLPIASALRVGAPTTRPTIASVASPAEPRVPQTPPKSGGAGQASALLVSAVVLTVVEPAAAEAAFWIAPTKAVLQPVLSLGTVFFLMRVVLSWFPNYNLNELPWSVVAAPTEPVLKPTRKLIPPVAGVDISPIVWVSILSFLSEILTGPQGLLTIMAKRG